MEIETKFELGPIQKAWIKSLRAHPERQGIGKLGFGTPRKYQACCLGEGLITLCRIKKRKLPFFDKIIRDGLIGTVLRNSYEELGLLSDNGEFLNDFFLLSKGEIKEELSCLSSANDCGYSWSEIADIMENNPEAIFTKSV